MDENKHRGRAPWQLAELEHCFEIRDADNRTLYVIRFYEVTPPVPNPLDLMERDEALKFARAVMKLPQLMRR